MFIYDIGQKIKSNAELRYFHDYLLRSKMYVNFDCIYRMQLYLITIHNTY